MREHGGKIPLGVLRIVVPAAPDAWITALKRYGTMSFGEVASGSDPARARRVPDVPADGREHRKAAGAAARMAVERRGLCCRTDARRKAGEVFRQTDLAASLQYMADEEKAAPRRAAARPGSKRRATPSTAATSPGRSSASSRSRAGCCRPRTWPNYHSPVVPPERRRFGDLEVFTCGAWCQGPVLLQTLALLEGTDLKALGHNSADYIHTLTEALKLAFADREAYYTDPAIGKVPLPTLISSEYAAERRKLIRPDRAWPEMPPPGELGAMEQRLRASPPNPNPEPDTSYVCAADRWGNLFSATPSDGSYGSPMVPGTGLIPSSAARSRARTRAIRPASRPASGRA